jgi:benzoate membrane transport protein
VLIFIATLGGQLSYGELMGASLLAGVAVVLLSALGLVNRLSAWLPAPIVFGLLAGAVLPYMSNVFTNLGVSPLLVGGTFLAYVVGRRVFGERVPPFLPALAVGVIIVAITRQFGPVPEMVVLPIPAFTAPVFTVRAVLTATPILVVLMTVQANLPSMVYLRAQGYQPPERVINLISGVTTALGSLLGPTAISLSLPATSLVGGPESGGLPERYRAIYVSSGFGLAIGLLAGVAAALPALIPPALLTTLTGLALVGVLLGALQGLVRGPLVLGPMFAFAIVLSQISFLGFGPFFWALVVGVLVSLALERAGWKKALEEAERGAEGG